MSATKLRYELFVEGDLIARYKTLGPALLGALWRSEKAGSVVAVYKDNECVGRVSYKWV